MSRITTILLAVIALIVVAVSIWLWQEKKPAVASNFQECVNAGYPVMESFPRQCRTPEGQTFVEDVEGQNPDEDGDIGANGSGATSDPRIRVTEPSANALVSSPLTVSGEARGTWYFEASFPVRLLDSEGDELAVMPAQAQGEWMTEDFVPFEVELTFNAPSTDTGVLVLERDNPSGLPENAAEVRIPVRFSKNAPAMMSVRAYFANTDLDPDPQVDCAAVFPVTRQVERTVGTARAALTELLEGPTAAEAARGFDTNIPSGVEIQDLRVEDGVAYADFSSKLNAVGGSCAVTSIRAQIEETLMQFPTVTSVVISIDGETEAILQP